MKLQNNIIEKLMKNREYIHRFHYLIDDKLEEIFDELKLEEKEYLIQHLLYSVGEGIYRFKNNMRRTK